MLKGKLKGKDRENIDISQVRDHHSSFQLLLFNLLYLKYIPHRKGGYFYLHGNPSKQINKSYWWRLALGKTYRVGWGWGVRDISLLPSSSFPSSQLLSQGPVQEPHVLIKCFRVSWAFSIILVFNRLHRAESIRVMRALKFQGSLWGSVPWKKKASSLVNSV